MKAGGEAFPRMVASLLPITAIGVGEMIAAAGAFLSSRLAPLRNRDGFVTTIAVVIMLYIALPRCARLGITRSGYPEASRYLQSTGEKKFMILGMEPVWRFYLGRVALDPYARPTSLKALVEKAQREYVRYVVVDFSTLYSKYGCEYTSSLIGLLKPVATFANPRGNSLPYLCDIFGFEKARAIARNPSAGTIFLFSVDDIARSRRDRS